jgi:hypothetical protein
MTSRGRVPLNRKFWRLPAYPGDLGVSAESLLQDFFNLGIVAMAQVGHKDYVISPGDYPIRKDYDSFLKSIGKAHDKSTTYADSVYQAFWGIKPGDRIILTHLNTVKAKGTATTPFIQNKDGSTDSTIDYTLFVRVKWDESALPDDTEKIDAGAMSFKDISDNDRYLKGYKEFELKSMTRLSHKPLNLILCGPPGTGKTYRTKELACEICLEDTLPEKGKGPKAAERIKAINECFEQLTMGTDKSRGITADRRVEFITFHPNYDYSDFIEGFRPNQKEGFDIVPGVLREIAARAAKPENKDKNFLLIIDEINRGNIAKIFGETITLLEEDKREGGTFTIKCHLPLSKESFCLPPNLYILGTMNTADRSIAMLDIALRRRFDFEDVPPNPELLKGADVKFGTDVVRQDELMENLNKALLRKDILGNRDYQIGHAWFAMEKLGKDGKPAKETPEERGKRLIECFRKKIIPLLQEWMHETPEKLWGESRDNVPVSLFGGIFGEEDDCGRGLASNAQTDEERETELIAAGEKIVQFSRRLTELAKKNKTS